MLNSTYFIVYRLTSKFLTILLFFPLETELLRLCEKLQQLEKKFAIILQNVNTNEATSNLLTIEHME